MRLFTARSLALSALVPALLLFVFVPGCAKQSEGERCGDIDYGIDSEDCDDGLICVLNTSLLNTATHRCCYPDGRVTDSRCEPKAAGSTPVPGAGGGGSGNAGGSSGRASGGAAGSMEAAGEGN
jgi:hypothetical protein